MSPQKAISPGKENKQNMIISCNDGRAVQLQRKNFKFQDKAAKGLFAGKKMFHYLFSIILVFFYFLLAYKKKIKSKDFNKLVGGTIVRSIYGSPLLQAHEGHVCKPIRPTNYPIYIKPALHFEGLAISLLEKQVSI